MRPRPCLKPLPTRGRIARAQPHGLPVINMGFNELPYPPSPSVADAVAGAANRIGRYGSPLCDDLRAAIGTRTGIDPGRIICGNGSEELLDVVARSFVRPGEHILISAFGYIQFEMTANRVGAVLAKAPERDLTTDVDALLAAITPETRLVFLANPNNPTGTMVSVDALARLAGEMPGDVLLVLDLAYGEFAGPDYCAAVHELARGHEHVVVTRTFSKAYGLAGTRVGWADAPAWMMPAFYTARGMGSVNGLAQAAALAALAEPDIVAARVADIVAERDRLARALRQSGAEIVPSSTNFLLVAPPDATPERTTALVEHLFDDAGIVVTPTREAGLERYFRISVSLPEHTDLLIASMRRFAGG